MGNYVACQKKVVFFMKHGVQLYFVVHLQLNFGVIVIKLHDYVVCKLEVLTLCQNCCCPAVTEYTTSPPFNCQMHLPNL